MYQDTNNILQHINVPFYVKIKVTFCFEEKYPPKTHRHQPLRIPYWTMAACEKGSKLWWLFLLIGGHYKQQISNREIQVSNDCLEKNAKWINKNIMKKTMFMFFFSFLIFSLCHEKLMKFFISFHIILWQSHSYPYPCSFSETFKENLSQSGRLLETQTICIENI